MPTYDDFLFWHGLYLHSKEEEEFEDINFQVEQLKTKVQVSGIFSDEDESLFYSIVRESYQRINQNFAERINCKISERKTRGQTFADEQSRIIHLLDTNDKDDLDIEKYIDINAELYDIAAIVLDKLGVEKFNILIAVAGIILGFLLGLLGGYLLKIWGVC
ncbi:hypothetical protein [Methanoregula sp.]|uniref:hypothetical protein n=1 Tax=Methanoregula sp. TaxID=2052170 RepID=UPI003BB1872C